MAFSYEAGHRTIWASDPLTELIYQIDMDPTGIEEGQPGSNADTGLSASTNPVAGAVTFTGTGFTGEAVIEVYSLSGRLVLSEPFGGAYSWSGAAEGGDMVPAGVYIAVVRDDSGGYAALTVTRLRP